MLTDEEYESWFNELEHCCVVTENGDKTYYPLDLIMLNQNLSRIKKSR